jgi:hypothetical protein
LDDLPQPRRLQTIERHAMVICRGAGRLFAANGNVRRRFDTDPDRVPLDREHVDRDANCWEDELFTGAGLEVHDWVSFPVSELGLAGGNRAAREGS